MITITFIIIIFIVLLLAIFNLSESKDSLTVVVAHYNENLDWTKNLNTNINCKVISRNGINKETRPNKGNEASIYLEYIIEHYYVLTDYTLFVHGHRTDWHHKENMDEKINRLIFDHEYFNINDQAVGKIDHNSLNYMLKSEFMTNIINLIDCDIDVSDIQYRCSAQFYVSKNKIQSNPIELYVKMYDLLMETDETSYWSGRVFEYLWHVIFTKNIIDK